MIKQTVLLVAASIASTFFKTQLAESVHFLLLGHAKIVTLLNGVFAEDPTGKMIQAVVTLIFIPLIFGGLLSMLHWMVKKKPMPHTLTLVWVIWAVLLTALLTQASVVVPA